MTNLTKTDVRAIVARLEKAIAAEFGDEMQIDTGSIRYGTGEVSFSKLTLKVKEEGESDTDLAQKDWEKNAFLIGLKKEDFGRIINYGGKKFKLSGLRLRRPKFPVAAVNMANGKEMLLDIRSVKAILGY